MPDHFCRWVGAVFSRPSRGADSPSTGLLLQLFYGAHSPAMLPRRVLKMGQVVSDHVSRFADTTRPCGVTGLLHVSAVQFGGKGDLPPEEGCVTDSCTAI